VFYFSIIISYNTTNEQGAGSKVTGNKEKTFVIYYVT